MAIKVTASGRLPPIVLDSDFPKRGRRCRLNRPHNRTAQAARRLCRLLNISVILARQYIVDDGVDDFPIPACKTGADLGIANALTWERRLNRFHDTSNRLVVRLDCNATPMVLRVAIDDVEYASVAFDLCDRDRSESGGVAFCG